MLKESQTEREYRMDAAQDRPTESLLCLMAPCRKLERLHCITLYGLLTRPPCTWWTSSCRTGTFRFFKELLNLLENAAASFSLAQEECKELFNFHKKTREYFGVKLCIKQHSLV